MTQPNGNADGRLEARYTVNRLAIRQRWALVIDVSRRKVVIEVAVLDEKDPIQAGDVLQLEITLPQFYGVPQRYLYCRCNVDAVKKCSDGQHLALTVDTMSFRDYFTKRLPQREMKSKVM
jgi:hypothetical protein